MIRIQRVPPEESAASPLVRLVRSGGAEALGMRVPGGAADLDAPPGRFDDRERGALARTLEQHLAPLAPHVAVLDAARSLAAPGACAVVTGQQPGFLASPLYCLYKALQAIALARTLAARWKVPVVPLFWNHADDHDIAEVHHAHLVNRNLDLQKISLAGLSSGRQPFSRIVLQEEANHLAAIRALLDQILEGLPHARPAVDLFAPRAGESIARAFTRTMTELLGPAGLVVLEPDWIRAEMSARLAHLAGGDPAPLLRRGAQRMVERGLSPAIDPAGAALVYHHAPEGRLALRAAGDGFRFDGEHGSRTPAELAAEIVQSPLGWSPGALLRPLVQDLCLPVAAYVGGWGELAYHAELPDLRKHAGVPATPFVPRVSCTLLDPECRVSLGKLGIGIEELVRGGRALEAGAPEPAGLPWMPRVRAIADGAARELEALRPDVAAFDPALLSQLKRAADQVRSAGEWLSEKVERVHQNRSGKGRRHLRRLNSWLLPREEPQERVLGPLPFVARYGFEWPRELGGALDPFSPDHLVVHLGDDVEGDES
jgi:bacillithiol biosynthesis cysteine-adding enzyme BshC